MRYDKTCFCARSKTFSKKRIAKLFVQISFQEPLYSRSSSSSFNERRFLVKQFARCNRNILFDRRSGASFELLPRKYGCELDQMLHAATYVRNSERTNFRSVCAATSAPTVETVRRNGQQYPILSGQLRFLTAVLYKRQLRCCRQRLQQRVPSRGCDDGTVHRGERFNRNRIQQQVFR